MNITSIAAQQTKFYHERTITMKKSKFTSLILGAAVAFQSLTCFTATAEYYDDANLIISVFNEDEGGFYTEDTDFMLIGSQQCAPGQAGAVYLGGFNTSEANPVEMNNISVDTRNTYVVKEVSKDLDGYNYYLDYKRSAISFDFNDEKNKKLELYMKKHYYIINSKQFDFHANGEEIFTETDAVQLAVLNVINSYDFMVLDSMQRVNAVDAVLEDLSEKGLITDYTFNDDDKTMEFTYNYDGVTGTLRPCVFIGRGETIDDIKPPKKAEHDINCDGNFAVSDIISLQNWLVNNERAAYINFKAADLCPDGKIDVFDLVAAKKEILSDPAAENEDIDFELKHQITQCSFSYINIDEFTYIVRSMNELNTVTYTLDGKAADIEGIDDNFFIDKALVLRYTVAGSSSARHKLNSIYSENGILKTNITTTYPEVMTCDMAYTRFVAAVDKAAVEGLTTDSPDISALSEYTEFSDK